MNTPLRILMVEDSEDDALLVIRELEKGGYTVKPQRVETAKEMTAALKKQNWDIVLADYRLPNFSGPDALKLLKQTSLDIPFLAVSGKIGEETAVELMLAGADDYVSKTNLKRLVPAIKRELRELEVRKERQRAEQQIISQSKFPSESPYPILRVSGEGTILYHNHASLPLLLGLHTEVGKRVPTGWGWLVGEALNNGIIKTDEAKFGDKIYLLNIVPIKDNDYVNIYATDITGRKQAEEKLKESEAKHRLLFETMVQGVVYQDMNGEITLTNQAAERILGLKLDQLQGRTSAHPGWRAIHEDGSDFFGETHPSMVALKTGKQVSNTVMGVYNPQEQQYRWININAIPQFRPGEEKPYQVYTTFEDITERKQNEASLRESEARFKTIFQSNPAALAITRPENGQLIDFNNAWLETVGYEREEVIGKNVTELKVWVNQNDRDNLIKMVQEYGKSRIETQLRRKTGELRDLLISAEIIEISQVPALITMALDITERKQAEKALEESEKRYRSLFQAAVEGITIVESDTRVIKYANPAFHKMLGYPPEEIIGMKIDRTHPENLWPEIFNNFENKMKVLETPTSSTLPLKKKDGTVILANINTVATEIDGKSSVIGFFTDVTEREETAVALKENEQRLREAQALGKIGSYEVNETTLEVIWSEEMYELFERDKNLPPPGVEEIPQYFPPDEFAKFLELRQAAFRDGKEAHGDITAKLSSGKTPIFRVSIRSVIDDNGRIMKSFGTFQDVTENRRAEAQLTLQAQLLDMAMESVFVHDQDSNIAYANQAACTLLGYSKEEYSKMKIFQITAPQQQQYIHDRTRELFAKGQKIFESVHLRKDNAVVPVEVYSKVVEIGGRKLALTGTRDITMRKQYESVLEQSYLKLQKTLEGVIAAVAAIIEIRDPYTSGHQHKTARLAHAIALEIGLPQEEVNGIYTAGLIHDVGKVGISSDILSKPGQLNALEYSLVKAHTQIGYDILKNIDFPYPVAKWILQHHERLNGTGYPNGLTGDQISMEAKVLAVADVVEAMASHRPYRAALGIEAALEEIKQQKNILYDGNIVDACLRLFQEKKFAFQ